MKGERRLAQDAVPDPLYEPALFHRPGKIGLGLPENQGRLTERSEVYVSNAVSIARTKCGPFATRREKGVDYAGPPVDSSIPKKVCDVLAVALSFGAVDPHLAEVPDNGVVGNVISELHKSERAWSRTANRLQNA